MTQTLIILKPNSCKREIISEICSYIQEHNFTFVKTIYKQFDSTYFEKLYQEHKGKSFYEGNNKFMSSDKVLVAIVEKNNAVSDMRELIGATNPVQAGSDTIRGKWYDERYDSIGENLIHGSDSVTSYERESKIFFS